MSGISHVTQFTPISFEQITVTTSAATLGSLCSAGVPARAKHMIIYPETNDVRWTADGTAPTTSSGLVLTANEQWIFEDQQTILNGMKLIAASSTTVNVHFFE